MKVPRVVRWINWALCVLFVLTLFGLLVGAAFGDTPDQAARWRSVRLDSKRSIELDKLVERYRRTAATYRAVEAMRANGAPAAVLFCLFYREADNNMADSPAQGDPLTHRSVNEPRGRIPGKTPPFAWRDAAEDAYYVVDRLDLTNWRDVRSALDRIESFNGFGYRAHGVPSPYLWGGTSWYGTPGGARGKYTSDSRFDPIAVDRQLGVCAVLKRMQERGIKLPF